MVDRNTKVKDCKVKTKLWIKRIRVDGWACMKIEPESLNIRDRVRVWECESLGGSVQVPEYECSNSNVPFPRRERILVKVRVGIFFSKDCKIFWGSCFPRELVGVVASIL